MSLKTDQELVQIFQQGSVDGFNELVRRYQERVYWIARRIAASHEDADDITQDVFVRVYEHLHQFRGDSSFYTWVYKIAVNVSLNLVQKKRVKHLLQFDQLLEETIPDDSSADGALLEKEYQVIFDRAVNRLPPKQRAVFMMRYYDGVPYEEMSMILKKSEGGLKANYFHAVKKIQEYVRRELSR